MSLEGGAKHVLAYFETPLGNEMPYEIFGWILTKDVECSWCGKSAAFYVTQNGIDQAAVCRTCTPEDATDRIALVFIEAMKQAESKQPQ